MVATFFSWTFVFVSKVWRMIANEYLHSANFSLAIENNFGFKSYHILETQCLYQAWQLQPHCAACWNNFSLSNYFDHVMSVLNEIFKVTKIQQIWKIYSCKEPFWLCYTQNKSLHSFPTICVDSNALGDFRSVGFLSIKSVRIIKCSFKKLKIKCFTFLIHLPKASC